MDKHKIKVLVAFLVVYPLWLWILVSSTSMFH